jgi:acyl carrier protein
MRPDLSKIRSFIEGSLSREVSDNENFFESGYVTSIFAVQIIAFLENEYGIDIDDEDLDLGNFSSADNILKFVTRKLR